MLVIEVEFNILVSLCILLIGLLSLVSGLVFSVSVVFVFILESFSFFGNSTGKSLVILMLSFLY